MPLGNAAIKAKQRHAPGTQLHQFALTQVDLALEYLTNPAHEQNKAIHETRRCIKRLRAILRLVKNDLTEATYHRDNIYLRNIGRELSALRDAAAALEALSTLQQQTADQFPAKTWQVLKKKLTAISHLPLLNKQQLIRSVVTKLKTAQQRIRRWNLDLVDEATIQKGLQRTYKKGRRAMREALSQPSVENLHEWRKQVNYLRHHLTILQTVVGIKTSALKDEFKTLATILGNNNDLAILSQYLAPLTPKLSTQQMDAIRQLIAAQQTALTTQALQIGQTIYEPKPKDLHKRIWVKTLTPN